MVDMQTNSSVFLVVVKLAVLVARLWGGSLDGDWIAIAITALPSLLDALGPLFQRERSHRADLAQLPAGSGKHARPHTARRAAKGRARTN
jgi:hypothetical protein